MTKKRRKYPASFKFKVALEATKEVNYYHLKVVAWKATEVA